MKIRVIEADVIDAMVGIRNGQEFDVINIREVDGVGLVYEFEYQHDLLKGKYGLAESQVESV